MTTQAPLNMRATEELHAEIKRPLTRYDYDPDESGQFDLWRDVFPLAHESELEYGTIYRLESLFREAGGWWYFPDANSDGFGEGQFHPIDEWLKMNSQQMIEGNTLSNSANPSYKSYKTSFLRPIPDAPPDSRRSLADLAFSVQVFFCACNLCAAPVS